MTRTLKPRESDADYLELLAAASGRTIDRRAGAVRGSVAGLLRDAERIGDAPNAQQASLMFLRRGLLEQPMPDGFTDGGRGTTFTMDDAGQVTAQSGNEERPLYLVDGREDENLRDMQVRIGRIMQRVTDDEAKALVLAQFVSNMTGGLAMTQERADADTAENLKDNPTRRVKLGNVLEGTCVPRALYYKYFADRMGMRCRLVRGYYDGGPHAWPEVQVRGQWHIIEMTGDMFELVGPEHEDWPKHERESDPA